MTDEELLNSYRENVRMNALFLQKVKDGLTSEGLQKLIDECPEKWERFSHWMELLD